MRLLREITNTLLARTNATDTIKTNMPRPQSSTLPPRFAITAEIKVTLVRRKRPPELRERRGPPQETCTRILNCYGNLHANAKSNNTRSELQQLVTFNNFLRILATEVWQTIRTSR